MVVHAAASGDDAHTVYTPSTGQRTATVTAPAGVILDGVYGAAAGDRTFVVTGSRQHGAGQGAGAGTLWYLLHVPPDRSDPARSLACAGHTRFGIFNGSAFTPLPLPSELAQAQPSDIAW